MQLFYSCDTVEALLTWTSTSESYVNHCEVITIEPPIVDHLEVKFSKYFRNGSIKIVIMKFIEIWTWSKSKLSLEYPNTILKAQDATTGTTIKCINEISPKWFYREYWQNHHRVEAQERWRQITYELDNGHGGCWYSLQDRLLELWSDKSTSYMPFWHLPWSLLFVTATTRILDMWHGTICQLVYTESLLASAHWPIVTVCQLFVALLIFPSNLIT